MISLLLSSIAAVACASSLLPQIEHRRIPESDVSQYVDRDLATLPHQTIGAYFDSLISEDQKKLNERTIHRTQAYTEEVWTDGTTTFNISMSRCVTMSDKAGFYTAKVGNLPNATVQDIVNDLQTREGSEAADRVQYTSRVKENAELAIHEINNFLSAGITGYTPITTVEGIDAHSELRHLLSVPAMAIIIIQSSLTTEIIVAFFAGLLGKVFGEGDSLGATLCAIQLFAVQIAVGINHVVQRRPVNFITATIFNVFLAWVRDSARAFAGEFYPEGNLKFLPSVAYEAIINGRADNQTVKGAWPDGSTWPLAQDLVEKALGTLGFVDQPRGRFLAATGFRPGGICPKL